MYSNKYDKTEEHAFRIFQADVKNGSLKNIILLCGEENYLIRWAKNTIVGTFVDEVTASMDYSVIDANDATPEMIMETCETMSMMSERRVLEITGYPTFDDEETVAEYIKNFPQHAQLIIRGNPSKRQGKLYNAIKKYGSVYDFGMLDRKTLKGFIKKEFRKNFVLCGEAEMNRIIQNCGYLNKDIDYSLDQLVNDIGKISALCGGTATAAETANETATIEKASTEMMSGGKVPKAPSEMALGEKRISKVSMEDVENIIGESLEKNIFDFVDAVNSGRKDKAYQMLDNLLLSGENFYRILATMITSIETLYMIRELWEEGSKIQDIGKILGKNQYYIKKLFEFARKMNLEAAGRMLINAYEIDGRVKTGRLDDRFAMEFFIAEV